MADYGNSRNYPPNHLSTGGTGLFWVLFAIAGHSRGVGADPIFVPADNAVVIE